MEIRSLYDICLTCAKTVHGGRTPTEAYARSAARLLVGTAATESHLVYRRQVGFSWESDRGAWGLFQTELGSVEMGLAALRKNAVLRDFSAAFVNQIAMDDTRVKPSTLDWLLDMPARMVLRVVAGNDRLGALFARLHYYRVPAPIPMRLQDQARYWKDHYNTRLGKGTPEKYMRDWDRLVEPMFSGKQ